MAQMISAENIQKLEFDVTTGEGPCHVTVITGSLPINVQIGSTPQVSKRLSIQRLHRGNFGKLRRSFHSLASQPLSHLQWDLTLLTPVPVDFPVRL